MPSLKRVLTAGVQSKRLSGGGGQNNGGADIGSVFVERFFIDLLQQVMDVWVASDYKGEREVSWGGLLYEWTEEGGGDDC
jgi:hypothetical protein